MGINMTNKKDTDQGYQGFSLDKSVRFYVTYDEEQGVFIADVFDSKLEEQDYGKAYIESFEFDSLDEAIEDLNQYKLKFIRGRSKFCVRIN